MQNRCARRHTWQLCDAIILQLGRCEGVGHAFIVLRFVGRLHLALHSSAPSHQLKTGMQMYR